MTRPPAQQRCPATAVGAVPEPTDPRFYIKRVAVARRPRLARCMAVKPTSGQVADSGEGSSKLPQARVGGTPHMSSASAFDSERSCHSAAFSRNQRWRKGLRSRREEVCTWREETERLAVQHGMCVRTPPNPTVGLGAIGCRLDRFAQPVLWRLQVVACRLERVADRHLDGHAECIP